MNKGLVRLVGIQIIFLGLVLSVFEFLIENSEIVLVTGLILFAFSLFLKK